MLGEFGIEPGRVGLEWVKAPEMGGWWGGGGWNEVEWRGWGIWRWESPRHEGPATDRSGNDFTRLVEGVCGPRHREVKPLLV